MRRLEYEHEVGGSVPGRFSEMTLPNFLIIGAQRSGTTWLDVRLRTHPDIYLPTRRKEVHFFDMYYDRGIEWYASFFKDPSARRCRATGETTPAYLFDPEVPERIHRYLPTCRLIAMLRNPVDRAYSQYTRSVRDRGISRSFETILQRGMGFTERGHYSKQLERYLKLFPRRQLRVFIFEETMEQPAGMLQEVAVFLGIEPHGFKLNEVDRRVNASYVPRFPKARAWARRIGNKFRDWDMEGIVTVAKRVGVPHLFGNKGKLPPLDPLVRQKLAAVYEPEINRLEKLLGRDLSIWRSQL